MFRVNGVGTKNIVKDLKYVHINEEENDEIAALFCLYFSMKFYCSNLIIASVTRDALKHLIRSMSDEVLIRYCFN